MALHVFVDESKERGYLVAAVALLPGNLASARNAVRGLILPRQRRLHFKQESNARRGAILTMILDLGVEVVIYDGASAANERPPDKRA